MTPGTSTGLHEHLLRARAVAQAQAVLLLQPGHHCLDALVRHFARLPPLGSLCRTTRVSSGKGSWGRLGLWLNMSPENPRITEPQNISAWRNSVHTLKTKLFILHMGKQRSRVGKYLAPSHRVSEQQRQDSGFPGQRFPISITLPLGCISYHDCPPQLLSPPPHPQGSGSDLLTAGIQ